MEKQTTFYKVKEISIETDGIHHLFHVLLGDERGSRGTGHTLSQAVVNACKGNNAKNQ